MTYGRALQLPSWTLTRSQSVFQQVTLAPAIETAPLGSIRTVMKSAGSYPEEDYS